MRTQFAWAALGLACLMTRATRVLAAADEFGSRQSVTVGRTWKDVSSPKACAILDHSFGGGVNEKKYDLPIVVSQTTGAEPDERDLLDPMTQIRDLRIEPPVTRPPGVTDVKLQRVLIRAGRGQARPDDRPLTQAGILTSSRTSLRQRPSRRRRHVSAFVLVQR